MKLEVKELLEEVGTEKRFHFVENWDRLETAQGQVEFTEPVVFDGKATNIDSNVLVQGNITSAVELHCSRCLKVFTYPINVDYIEQYCRVNKDGHDECRLFHGNEIDFTQPVIEELILALPMKWLCREKCEGLCLQCGQDLNVAKCDCQVEDINPRMEVLKKFFEKE